MADIKELRAESVEGLIVREADKQSELFEMKYKMRTHDKKVRPHMIRQLKQEIAQIKTIVTEKTGGK